MPDFSSEKRYDAAALCAVAGVKPVTLRAWRNRHGFLSNAVSKDVESPQGRRNTYSLIDIMTARMVVQLTELGVQTSDAVQFTQTQGIELFVAWDAADADMDAVFHFISVRYCDGELEAKLHNADAKLDDVFADSNASAAVVSISDIAMEVIDDITELSPLTLASPGSATAVVATAMAKVFSETKDSSDD